MHEYYCQFHPLGMRGDMALDEGADEGVIGNGTQAQADGTENQTEQNITR